ncbi:MAG: single-stranded-DNA-specific exonuclease RecJ [Ferruginibacter sp.]
MDKRWNILKADNAHVASLQSELKINPTICKILVQRGIDNFEKSKSFFRPQLSDLHDPFLMKDMDKAVARILHAIDSGEKVLVYGDYDVDGTTSVACMYQFLCQVHNADLMDYYIPHRYREGYGVSKAGIDYAAVNNYSLIISLDCGIKSVELVAYAKTLGIDFIICDHHLPDIVLPEAVAILNPKQIDCNYPYKELCGCGVGFKLITALALHFNIDETFYYSYLDLVATAIAADIVPMTGENRILAYHGLQQINHNPRPGIASLIKLGNVQGKLTITNVVFIIAPRVNAAGRMDDAKKAVQLFIEKDPVKAFEFAEMLHSDNSERKEADSSITEEALSVIENDVLLVNKKSTVVYKEYWHKGVVGIVASRLIEKYYRPTVVLTKSGEFVTGSARSVTGFNLYEAVHACRAFLTSYGGHFAAAGLSMLPENVAAFTAKFEEEVAATIPDHLLIPEIVIDSELTFPEIIDSFYNIVCQMEPFGPENMRPVFIATNVMDTGYSKIVKESHIRFVLQQHDRTITGIGFNLAGNFHILEQKKPMDILFTIDQNEWNGETSLQLKMIDFRLSPTEE